MVCRQCKCAPSRQATTFLSICRRSMASRYKHVHDEGYKDGVDGNVPAELDLEGSHLSMAVP